MGFASFLEDLSSRYWEDQEFALQDGREIGVGRAKPRYNGQSTDAHDLDDSAQLLNRLNALAGAVRNGIAESDWLRFAKCVDASAADLRLLKIRVLELTTNQFLDEGNGLIDQWRHTVKHGNEITSCLLPYVRAVRMIVRNSKLPATDQYNIQTVGLNVLTGWDDQIAMLVELERECERLSANTIDAMLEQHLRSDRAHVTRD